MELIDKSKYLSEGEMRELCKSAEARYMLDRRQGRTGGVISWLLVDMALSTALRVGELEAIKLRDIDLKERTIEITRLKRKKKEAELLPLDPGLAKHIQEYLGWREKSAGHPMNKEEALEWWEVVKAELTRKAELTGKKKKIPPRPKDAFLFWGERGPLSRSGLQQRWHAAVRRAGLSKKYSIHSARHSVATKMMNDKKDLILVQKCLGHSSPVTTGNMYCHKTLEEMREGFSAVRDNGE